MSEGEEFAVRSNCLRWRSVFKFVRNVRDCNCWEDGVGRSDEDEVPSSECCNRPRPKLDDVWNGALLLNVVLWRFEDPPLKYLTVFDVVDWVVENASWWDDNKLLPITEIGETADDNWLRNLRCSRASLNRVKSFILILVDIVCMFCVYCGERLEQVGRKTTTQNSEV